MAVRVTVEIPEGLHHRLRLRARESGTSMRSLVIRAIEDACNEPKKGKRVSGPLISGGRRGPAYPRDENPHDLVFS